MIRVLVVDDSEDVLNLTQVILESEGYDVVAASSGEEASRLIVDANST